MSSAVRFPLRAAVSGFAAMVVLIAGVPAVAASPIATEAPATGSVSGSTPTIGGNPSEVGSEPSTVDIDKGSIECLPRAAATVDGRKAWSHWGRCALQAPKAVITDGPSRATSTFASCPMKIYVWRFYGTNTSPTMGASLSEGAFAVECGGSRKWTVYFSSPVDAGAKAPVNTIHNVRNNSELAALLNTSVTDLEMYGSESCVKSDPENINLWRDVAIRKDCAVTAGLQLASVGTICRNLTTEGPGADNSPADWLASGDPRKIRQAKLALLFNYAEVRKGRTGPFAHPVASQLAGLGGTNVSAPAIPDVLARTALAEVGSGDLPTSGFSPEFEAALSAWSPRVDSSVPCATPVQYVDMLLPYTDPGARIMGMCIAAVENRGYITEGRDEVLSAPWSGDPAWKGLWPTFSMATPLLDTAKSPVLFNGTMLHTAQLPRPVGPALESDLSAAGRDWDSVVANSRKYSPTASNWRLLLRAKYAVAMRDTLRKVYDSPSVPTNRGSFIGLDFNAPGDKAMPRRPGLYNSQTTPGAIVGSSVGQSAEYFVDRTPYSSADQQIDLAALHLYRTALCYESRLDSGLKTGFSTPADPGDIAPEPTPTPTEVIPGCTVNCAGGTLPYTPTPAGTGELRVTVDMPDGLYAAGKYREYRTRITSVNLMCSSGSRVCNPSTGRDGSGRDDRGANVDPVLRYATGQLQVRPVGVDAGQFRACRQGQSSGGCAFTMDPSASRDSAALAGQFVDMSFFTGTPGESRVKAVVSGGSAVIQRYRWDPRSETYQCNPRQETTYGPYDPVTRTRPVTGSRTVWDTCTRYFSVRVPDGPPQEIGVRLVPDAGSPANLEARVYGSVGGSGG